MTTEYTDHFRLNLPDFRMGPWHDLVNEDFIAIDQLLFALYQGVDTQIWQNATLYTPGTTAIDPDDNSFWVAIVEHTSAPAGSFSDDRAAHPTFWNRVVVGIAPRGEWQNSTHYLPNDMVSSSPEHVIAVCTTEHTSNASGTIRDDSAYWSFIADIGSAAAIAANIAYDNTTSGASGTNLQATTDDLYAKHTTQQIILDAIAPDVTDHETRIDALEASDTAQNAAITDATSDITNLDTRVTAAEGTITGHETRIDNLEASDTSQDAAITSLIASDVSLDSRVDALEAGGSGVPEAPNDGNTYGRKNLGWIAITSGGASVTISDTPPGSPTAGNLWWESDTGLLYIYYDDGSTSQWVSVVGSTDPSLYSVRFDIAQSLTDAQETQARQNIYAAPLEAMIGQNIILNGGFEVSQEHGGAGVNAANNATTYIVDQWAVSRNHAAATAAFVCGQGAGQPSIGPNYMGITATAALSSPGSSDYAMALQRIEGYRWNRLYYGSSSAKEITVGFWVFTTISGTATFSIKNGASNRSYLKNFSITGGVYNWISFTVPGDQSGTWEVGNLQGAQIGICFAAGSSLQGTNEAWQAGNFIGTSATTNFFATTNNLATVAGVVILPGAHVFDSTLVNRFSRSYQEELALCQRHYWRTPNGLNYPYLFGYAGASGYVSNPLKWPVTMRAGPTVTKVGTWTVINCGQPVFDIPTIEGCRAYILATATGTLSAAPDVTGMYITANARL